MMSLVDVYGEPRAAQVLFDLLAEREPHQNISHKVMPTWGQHVAFMVLRPYAAWYLICDDDAPGEAGPVMVGAIYLTPRREVGLFIFKAHRGKGYGSWALDELRERHPGSLLANIAPGNDDSRAFFERHGFKLIQHTYAAT